jgi:hypothetical protein
VYIDQKVKAAHRCAAECYCLGAEGNAAPVVFSWVLGACSAAVMGVLGWLANKAKMKQLTINAVARIAVVRVKKSVFPRTEKKDPVDCDDPNPPPSERCNSIMPINETAKIMCRVISTAVMGSSFQIVKFSLLYRTLIDLSSLDKN